jgi:protein-tyrosine phosphatase
VDIVETPQAIAPLPPRRGEGPYQVVMVCLGNICRSPVADVVLGAKVEAAGLAGRVEVSSCGTADWHRGKPMDPRSGETLTDSGYDATRHRARQFRVEWLDTHDLLLAMDAGNLADIGGRGDRVRLFRDFDPVGTGGEVPDPYYGGPQGFQEVLEMVERTCDTLVGLLRAEVDPGDGARVVP